MKETKFSCSTVAGKFIIPRVRKVLVDMQISVAIHDPFCQPVKFSNLHSVQCMLIVYSTTH